MTTPITETRPAFSLKVLAPGFVAGIAMAMWQMIMEAILPNGSGFWSPPIYIGATVVRNLQNVPTPVPFDLVGVIVGLMGHMMNAIIFGLIFTYLIAPRIQSLTGQVVAGAIYLVAIYVVMWFVIAPLVDPAALRLNAVVFLIGHVIFGVVLGWVNYQVTRTA